MRSGFLWLTISQERCARALFSSADIALLLSYPASAKAGLFPTTGMMPPG
jgi:hypothetical protein